jgi:hypothetical protein
MRFGVPPVVTFVESGPADVKIDVAIMGDGYTESELPKFAADVQRAVDALLAVTPFSDRPHAFNLYRVDVISRGSGADHLKKGDGRYGLSVKNDVNVQIASRKAPACDFRIVIVNDGLSGGAAKTYLNTATTYNGPDMTSIVPHEMGHTVGLLADEYWFSGWRYSGPELPEVNATINNDPATVKWARHLGIEGIGILEGCHYVQYGIYRPHNACRMRCSGGCEFCRVCREDGLLPRMNLYAPPLQRLAVVPASEGGSLGGSFTVRVGGVLDLDDLSRYANGNTYWNLGAAWTSGDPAVATVDADGVVRGVAVGTTSVTAEREGVVGTVQVQVVP